jgi:hypothetical protein
MERISGSCKSKVSVLKEMIPDIIIPYFSPKNNIVMILYQWYNLGMQKNTRLVQTFFERLETVGNELDIQGIGELYADTFMFADPTGTRSINKEDFLKVLPKRKDFFEKVGLKYTKYESLDEKVIDEHYYMVEAHIVMHFEKDPHNPIDDKDSSTFILHKENESLKIVFHLEHRELMKKIQEIGLI